MPRSQLLIFIGIGALVLIIVLAVGGLIFGRKTSTPRPVTIEFWGTEDEDTWQDAITKFHEENTHITLNYTRLNEATYEETLLNRLAEGKGPDVFLLKNSWITKHRDKIFPLPQNIFDVSPRTVRASFVDGVSEELVQNDGAIIGLPVFVDTPALFYNKDIFNASGVAEPPRTWENATQLTLGFTKLTPAGDITRAGIALGDARNVEHAFEILSSLMLQNGAGVIDRQTNTVALGQGAISALEFYALFSDRRSKNFSWNARMKNSLDSFAEGEAVMAIGLPEDIRRIRAKNPHLNFAISPLPQLKDARKHAVHASYFFPTVSKQTLNPVAAWQFVLFLASPEGAKTYLKKTGKAPARRDLAAAGTASAEQDVFYKQTLIAQGWPVPDEQRTRRIFEETISSVTSKAARPEEAISRLGEQLQLLLP